MASTTSHERDYLVCTFEDCRIGIPIECVDRVIPAAEVTRVEESPRSVLGAIDYHGSLYPVFSARQRLGYEQPPVRATNKFVIIHTSKRSSALCVDSVQSVKRIAASDNGADELTAESLRLEGIAQSDDGLVVILDMDRFLARDDENRLQRLLDELKAREQE